MLKSAKKRAENKNFPFAIEMWHLRELYHSGGGRCALSGLKFKHGVKENCPYSMSLDRIEPERGYVEGNIRLILLGLNGLKHSGTDKEALDIARAFVRMAASASSLASDFDAPQELSQDGGGAEASYGGAPASDGHGS